MYSQEFDYQKEIIEILHLYLKLALKFDDKDKQREFVDLIKYFTTVKLSKAEAEEKFCKLMKIDFTKINKFIKYIETVEIKDFACLEGLEECIQGTGLELKDVRRASCTIGRAKFYGNGGKDKTLWLKAYANEIRRCLFTPGQKITKDKKEARENLYLTIYSKVIDAMEQI